MSAEKFGNGKDRLQDHEITRSREQGEDFQKKHEKLRTARELLAHYESEDRQTEKKALKNSLDKILDPQFGQIAAAKAEATHNAELLIASLSNQIQEQFGMSAPRLQAQLEAFEVTDGGLIWPKEESVG